MTDNQNLFSYAIPALREVVDPFARGFLAKDRAPGIEAVTSRNKSHLIAASAEKRSRKKLRINYSETVTEAEIVDTKVQTSKIERDILFGEGELNNVPPPWAQALINEMRENRNEMREHRNEMREEMRRHGEQIQNLTRGFKLLELNMKNTIRRFKNKDSHAAQLRGFLNLEFLSILKTIPGTRDTTLRGGAPLQIDGIEVGHSYVSFPRTSHEIFEMNQNQIEILAHVYNEDFGILPEDRIVEQRHKVLHWILEDPM